MADKPLKDIGPDNTLLIVDDDEPFLKRLARAMEKRGFAVETAESVAAGTAIATARPPAPTAGMVTKASSATPSPSASDTMNWSPGCPLGIRSSG